MIPQIRIGGVPEYFNLPIYQAIEKGVFQDRGIDLVWENVSEGTGAMAKKLSSGELDLAVILTEGITKSIIDGNPSRIIKNYVESPLVWGVHVPYSKGILSLDELDKKKIAISRFGSGSHLMSFLLAQRENWEKEDFAFHVINNLDGARESFGNHETNVFLWEKHTTQPYVDAKEFDRIDHVETPWPCFVIAANNDALSKNTSNIKQICDLINGACMSLQSNHNLPKIISDTFNLKLENTEKIANEVKWSTKTEVNGEALHKVMNTLSELDLIQNKIPMDQLVFSF
ncbi:MAG: ABC transporter substrate-binding protein [Cyclobacteriaceae bacterium]